MNLLLIITLAALLPTLTVIVATLILRASQKNPQLFQQLQQMDVQRENIFKLLEGQQKTLYEYQIKSLTTLQDSLRQSFQDIRLQMLGTLSQHAEHLGKSVDKLTTEVHERLKEISGQVDKRLSEGFEKTTETFTDVIKRLTIIDEAQKKITELSSNVVSLQEVLSDKRSRGAFGEVQLNALIRNMLPESHFKLQHTLSNGKRVDCLLLLPEPTGHIAIDSKFPLESYRLLNHKDISTSDKQLAEQQFKQDIKKHILDIAQKYILEGETSEGAVMFIPAEAIFSDIHAHYPELIELAHKERVWLVSPTTMMAILTTARAVLKDAATRKQVHIIQEHLVALSKDFKRFQERMDKLSIHIHQAHQDVELVHKSSQKITHRFIKIEGVELPKEATEKMSLLEKTE